MKTWLTKIIGKEQKSPLAGEVESVPPQADAEQMIPTDVGQTVLASTPDDPHAIPAAEAQVAAEWKVGDVILDLYEVKHIYEGGGMGLVYRVHHRGWNTDLAVKSPRSDYFSTEAQKENFTRECETWIKLGLHPHIVSCHYVRTMGGIPRVFAEYVEGGSLKEWIDSRRLYECGPQDALKRIFDIAIQMAWGLHYAHETGLIHQDVKPANVLMLPDGMAKISDFGLAKARAAAGEPVAVGVGRSIVVSSGGMTPAYCSPEQANKQHLSRKTDIWSWAISVMEMFVGEVCWQSGAAAPEVLKRMSEVRVEGVGVPEPPPALMQLLEQCLNMEPGSRPESFIAIASALISIYNAVVGEEYVRTLTQGVGMRADGLNNRALSLLDLGRSEESVAVFEQALEVEPGHPESLYNRGLLTWRRGKITDKALLDSIHAATAGTDRSQRGNYLKGLVNLERGDATKAVECLKSACAEGEPSLELRTTLEQAEALAAEPPQSRSFDGHTKAVTSLAFTGDGRFILSGSDDTTLRLWEASSGRCIRVFESQKLEVKAVAVSSDGRWAISGAHNEHQQKERENTLCLWETSSGRMVRSFDGHTANVHALAISADGRRMLVGSWNEETSEGCALANFAKDPLRKGSSGLAIMLAEHERKVKSGYYIRALRLWDIESGRCVRNFDQPPGNVDCVALSPNGQWAFGGIEKYKHYGDGSVRQWDVSSGRCVRVMEGHSDGTGCLALSSDGRWLVSGGGDAALRLWDVASGGCIRVLEGHRGKVGTVAISPDDRLVLSSSGDSTVRLWEVATGRCLRTFEESSVKAFSRDGRWAVAAGSKALRMWELPTERRSPWVMVRPVSSRAQLLEAARYNAALRRGQSLAKNQEWDGAASAAKDAMRCVGYSRAREASNLLREANLRGQRTELREVIARIIPTSQSISSAALSHDGRWAVSCSGPHVYLWDLAEARCVRTFEGHKNIVHEVCLSGDGRIAASSSGVMTNSRRTNLPQGIKEIQVNTGFIVSDDTVRIWDTHTGSCLQVLKGHDGIVSTVALSMDGRWALSGSSDNTVKLWDVATGACLRTFEGHRNPLASVCLSSDGRLALSAGNNNALRLWDVATGRCLGSFEGHSNVTRMDQDKARAFEMFGYVSETVQSVCLSSDYRLALSGSSDNTLKLWETATGRCVRTFEGHKGAVRSVTLSADGRFAVSGSGDHTIRIWDTATGACLRTLEGHEASVNSVALSPDGRFVLSGGADNTLRLWELDWQFKFPQVREWDEGALSYLIVFLTQHCPLGDDGLTRGGRPVWTDEDFEGLLTDLQFRGYGWLRPEGARRQLEKMTADWQGPPPLTAVSTVSQPKLLSKSTLPPTDKPELVGVAGQREADIVQALPGKKSEITKTNNRVSTLIRAALIWIMAWNRSALRMASQEGNLDLVQALLAKGANVNARRKDGATALMMASEKGHLAVMQVLLDKGAEVNAKTDKGVTALNLASFKGRLDVVQALLDEKVELNGKTNTGATALTDASEHGHREVVQALLAHGADIDARLNTGSTALYLASQNGHYGVVQALLDKGVDLNAKAKDGSTALIPAAQNGHLKVVQALLDKGAEINTKADGGISALIPAAQNDHGEVVQLLLTKGADVNAKMDNGQTALIVAANHGHINVVQELLEKQADVNAKMNAGWTALIIASLNGHREVVRALLAEGAEVNAKTNEGATALSVASQKGHLEVRAILLEAGAKP
jgi:WD40 repeat protein/ankyrin repeat protein/serine/threonine protein kinase